MELTANSDKLIYLRLKEWLEDAILAGSFPEDSQIPSVAELSVSFKMNHITVLKSINLLSDEGILYKKRGIGTFVSTGAKEQIREQRYGGFYRKYVAEMITEAKKLGISKDALLQMAEKGYDDE